MGHSSEIVVLGQLYDELAKMGIYTSLECVKQMKKKIIFY